MASSGPPCSSAAFNVASGWLDPKGLWTNRFLLLASSSQASNFQNSFNLKQILNKDSVNIQGENVKIPGSLLIHITPRAMFVRHDISNFF